MNDIEFDVCFILENEYKQFNDLPEKWSEISKNIKSEILALALNNNEKIEELDEYKELVNNL